MDTFNSILRGLRIEKGLSQQALADLLGISKSSVNMYERGERQPNFETLEIIADFFNVDIDFLLGRSTKTTKIIQPQSLNRKDEKDISNTLSQLINQLEQEESALMFDGEPLDEESKELLKNSLENSLKTAKLIAKQKYTPNKYKK